MRKVAVAVVPTSTHTSSGRFQRGELWNYSSSFLSVEQPQEPVAKTKKRRH